MQLDGFVNPAICDTFVSTPEVERCGPSRYNSMKQPTHGTQSTAPLLASKWFQLHMPSACDALWIAGGYAISDYLYCAAARLLQPPRGHTEPDADLLLEDPPSEHPLESPGTHQLVAESISDRMAVCVDLFIRCGLAPVWEELLYRYFVSMHTLLFTLLLCM